MCKNFAYFEATLSVDSFLVEPLSLFSGFSTIFFDDTTCCVGTDGRNKHERVDLREPCIINVLRTR